MTNCRYFIPGPTWVRPEILQEMTRPMIGHRSGEFKSLFRGLQPNLKALFRTTQHTFVATSSGTGVLEGALLNCVPRSVLVTSCGAFSERWFHMAQQLGLEVDHLQIEWGQSIDPAQLENYLTGRRHHYDAVTITHNETSTGVMSDLQTLARVVNETSGDTLILVDAVSSLGSAPIEFDAWGLDVCIASVQKGLALPPGITVFAVSERAMARAEKKSYRGTYFDFLEFRNHAAEDGVPFTPSIPHCYALARKLEEIIKDETLEKRWDRHRAMRDLTLQKTEPYAQPMYAPDVASVSVSTLRPSKRGAPAEIVSDMKERGFVIGRGYGKWKEETFRIGHMGDITLEDLSAMLDVLGEVAG